LQGILKNLYTNRPERTMNLRTGYLGAEYFNRFLRLELIRDNTELVSLIKQYYYSDDQELIKLGDELIKNHLESTK